ncbi:hypothetical protein G7B40_032935 [Aetokthonos hydrillicola Thurmond2011]|jgi:hypothetical protein|uniref:Uncharacterized protein n=1 Tax=Aetokthonos hydrillicola Thurmond2011 TaxID=2712845 RepID=A0AAP5ID36_9CYAN|nr:hypothetical protein [Aetokthonos hydrillicola]MBO3458001.1 hypothetical protein [Aetokthonos hydrillicola CCALA 1050]MBW4587165.1 hypothetical protein [Aetokthonos hydrillicola CCALA 1050]MDR9899333.1 hypothetical protein [Aetokthonos hydrillicola Thurmond2011]
MLSNYGWLYQPHAWVLEKTTCNADELIAQAVEGVHAIAKQQNINFNIHPSNAQVCPHGNHRSHH